MTIFEAELNFFMDAAPACCGYLVKDSGHFGLMAPDNLEQTRHKLFLEKAQELFGPRDAESILRALNFARGKLRWDGNIAFSTAQLLMDQGADSLTLAVALLAPTVWLGRADLHEIGKLFGPGIATAVGEIDFPVTSRTDTEHNRRSDLHKSLKSLTGDTRRALLNISFRLIQLEHAVECGTHDARDAAREAVDVYVPIASRLGLRELCKRLENASFLILDPVAYEALERRVKPIREEDEACLQILHEGVERLLNKNGIKCIVQGRTKSLYSIHCKMLKTGATLDAIMDRIGLRIIVGKVAECYSVLGLLHTHYRPIPGTFDDYIGLPKENGYQSLHTCVYPVRDISRKPIEFQIRTEFMHIEAEYGTAAHWRYKTGAESAETAYSQTRWLQALVGQHCSAPSTDEFLRLLHRQVYEDHLVVFGRAGLIARLSGDATVLDYIKRYCPDCSHQTQVKVNGTTVPLDHRLCDGDTIEIVAEKKTDESRASAQRGTALSEATPAR